MPNPSRCCDCGAPVAVTVRADNACLGGLITVRIKRGATTLATTVGTGSATYAAAVAGETLTAEITIDRSLAATGFPHGYPNLFGRPTTWSTSESFTVASTGPQTVDVAVPPFHVLTFADDGTAGGIGCVGADWSLTAPDSTVASGVSEGSSVSTWTDLPGTYTAALSGPSCWHRDPATATVTLDGTACDRTVSPHMPPSAGYINAGSGGGHFCAAIRQNWRLATKYGSFDFALANGETSQTFVACFRATDPEGLGVTFTPPLLNLNQIRCSGTGANVRAVYQVTFNGIFFVVQKAVTAGTCHTAGGCPDNFGLVDIEEVVTGIPPADCLTMGYGSIATSGQTAPWGECLGNGPVYPASLPGASVTIGGGGCPTKTVDVAGLAETVTLSEI